MNFIALSFSLCATLCLAADKSSTVDLTPVTETAQSAYELGCKLAEKEGILITNTAGRQISMEVDVSELIKVVDVNCEESTPFIVGLSKVFDIKYLERRISLFSNPMEFTEFRGMLLNAALDPVNPEARIIADAAILKWIVHAIDNKGDGRVVFKAYDLKVVCSLCLHPELATDKLIIAGVTKVLNESVIFVQHLSTDYMKDFVGVLIAISNSLESHEISAELNEVLDAIVSFVAEREDALEHLELLAQLEAYEALF